MALVLPPAWDHIDPQPLPWNPGLLQGTDVSSPGHRRAQSQEWKCHCQQLNLRGSSRALGPSPARQRHLPELAPGLPGIPSMREKSMHPPSRQVGAHLSRGTGDLSEVVPGLLYFVLPPELQPSRSCLCHLPAAGSLGRRSQAGRSCGNTDLAAHSHAFPPCLGSHREEPREHGHLAARSHAFPPRLGSQRGQLRDPQDSQPPGSREGENGVPEAPKIIHL